MTRPNWSIFGCTSSAATTVAALLFAFVLSLAVNQAAQAQTYHVIHYFTGGADGDEPWAGLTIDAGGNLYGVAEGGGDLHFCRGFGCGTVFKLMHTDSGWAFTTLYQFHGFDGAAPQANLVFGADGALYGTTGAGGELQGWCDDGCGGGTVFKLQQTDPECQGPNCAWTETTLYRFNSFDDGVNPSSPLTFDSAGNIYGTTPNGGSASLGVVYRLRYSEGGWSEQLVHTFTGPPDGAVPYSNVLIDRAGNLYGTAQGYDYSGGVIYELMPGQSGWTENILHTFTYNEGIDPIGGVSTDLAGNFYGATAGGGYGNGEYGVVYELSRSGSSGTSTRFMTCRAQAADHGAISRSTAPATCMERQRAIFLSCS